MNKVLTMILIVLAFAGGYLTGSYQATNQTDHNFKSNSSPQSTPSPIEIELVNKNPAKSEQPTTHPSRTVSSDPQSPHNEDRVAVLSEKPDTKEEGSYGDKNDVISESSQEKLSDFPLAQRELEEWQVKHKEELKSRMEEVLGEYADLMFDKIVQESPLLNEASAENSLEDDLAWRYQAEQVLTDFILNNTNDASVELLQVTCIQKKCEITMTGNNQQSATNLYMQITTQKPFGLKATSSPTLYIQDDNSYWLYLALFF